MSWLRWGALVVSLCGSLWLVVLSPAHFGDDVIWTFNAGRGVEQHDVPAVLFFTLGAWGAWGLRPRSRHSAVTDG